MYCVHFIKIKDERKHIELYPFTCRLFICLYILKYIGCLVNFDHTFSLCPISNVPFSCLEFCLWRNEYFYPRPSYFTF